MARGRLSLPQLKKYDVTQKVIAALANVESRAILFALVRAERTVPELVARLRIPQSTVYKKIDELEELSLIKSKIVFIEGHGRARAYRSRIRSASINVRGTEPRVTLEPNKI